VVLISVVTASISQPSTSASTQPRVFSHSAILAGHSSTKGTWSIKKHTKTEGKIPRHIPGDHCGGMYIVFPHGVTNFLYPATHNIYCQIMCILQL
jgi:hypothetical protein